VTVDALTNTRRESTSGLRSARPRRFRTMREFVEQELRLTGGPREGEMFRCDSQPYSRLWFDLVESGRWRRMFACGPQQSGKTLCGSVAPVLYHLFEVGERVIYGVPSGDMAEDKWEEDLKPAIEAGRYADLMPSAGGGAKGAFATAIRFRNGATLRFMFAGGNDKTRAGFTSRVLVCTEVDGFDTVGTRSREADKFSQLEGRTSAHAAAARIYGECTVSTEAGRTWREYKQGTETRILRPCPHCGRWVIPEREQLVGWQAAESIVQAREKSAFHCPECGEEWTEEQRYEANRQSRAVHRGQEITPDGEVVGPLPETETLGFRWTAADNHLKNAGDVGADEYAAAHAPEPDVADLKLRQWSWTLPAKPVAEDMTRLDRHKVARRIADTPRKVVPAGAVCVTAGVDGGKWRCHWEAIAWFDDGSGVVIEYGWQPVLSDQVAEEIALVAALRELRDAVFEPGWRDEDGEPVRPLAVWIDSGWQTQAVYSFCRECPRDRGRRYWPAKGLGQSIDKPRPYSAPKARSKSVRQIGDGYHLARLEGGTLLWEIDADRWKTWLHARLTVPEGKAGALRLFKADWQDHLLFGRHQAAERRVQEFKPGEGMRERWDRVDRENHWLDSGYLACAAGHWCGIRLLPDRTPTPPRVAVPNIQEPSAPPGGW
jgi:phage terminase large subunit GpA-like protein